MKSKNLDLQVPLNTPPVQHHYSVPMKKISRDHPKEISIPIFEDNPHLSLYPTPPQPYNSFSENVLIQNQRKSQSYPSPNLYKLSLLLTTELDIRKWWDNVIEILTSSYCATRILLSVPHDLTDTINTSWGVKATYHKDYCCPGNSCYPDSIDSCSTSSSDSGHPVYESLKDFDREVDPLVNNEGILRILQTGNITVLTREYKLQNEESNMNSLNNGSHQKKLLDTKDESLVGSFENGIYQNEVSDSHDPNDQWSRVLDTPCLNDLEEGQNSYFQINRKSLFNIHYHHRSTSEFQEKEQHQLSPWAQPISATDKTENPYFQTLPKIDDESFNPSNVTFSQSPANNNSHSAVTEHIYSIVHIPLIHPTTVKNVAPTNANHTPVPIAILSFLSCIAPYPEELLKSLKVLAPFMATTLSVSMIHQQISSYANSIRERRRRSSQKSNATVNPLSVGLADEDDNDSMSSGYSTSSTSSSKWEYATVFSTTYGHSPHADSSGDDPFNDSDNLFSRLNDDEFTPESEGLTCDDSSPTPSTPQGPVKSRRVSLPTDRKRRQSRNSIKASNVPGNLHRRHNSSAQPALMEKPRLIIPNTKMLRLLMDLMPNVVYTCTPGLGDCTWVNMRLLKYTGRSIDDLLGHGWMEVVHPEDRPRVLEMWNNTFSRGEGSSAEYRMRRFDGQYRWFLGRAGPLRDARGVNIRWFGTCTDVHDQKLAEQVQSRQVHIEANEKKYRLLAEAIPQIVFTATPKDGITYVNKKWLDYSSQTEDEAKNLGFLFHVHPDDRIRCRLPEEKGSDEMTYSTEVRLMRSDGEHRWFLVKCISVEVSDQGRKWFGTCTDINDHKMVEQKLKEAHDAAKRSTESKTRFLSNMSHEIRTPLIGITGMINFMLATTLTVEQLDYAHTIQQSADALLLVINDILDLSKVEAGMMKLEKEPFSVHNMIEDANELLSTLAIQKGLELSFIVDDNVPDVICGDRIRLRQVLLNVIGNAIKFTSKGEVFSRCSLSVTYEDELNENEMMLMFEVVDTGDGFDTEEEAVMFKPFSQVDTSSTRKHGGSGLGLVISRQLIELHGGKMSCKSKKGVGSTFYFSAKFVIPADSTAPRPPTPTSEVSNSPFFRHIADLPYARETLTHYVRSILPKCPAPEIEVSCSYNEARDRLSSEELKSYTHILINLASQPQVISLASIIKHAMHLSLTVTVILTTPIQRAGIVEGTQNDLPERVEFIFKPLNRSKMEGLFDVTTTVRENFLKRRNTHKIVASQKEVFKRMADDVGDKGFRVLLVEDNEVNQKVMTKYLTKVGLGVEIANNGEECLKKFYSHPHSYYSLILCDLFMPVKDGYETAAEIRAWEARNLKFESQLPIIALSANVMSDVANKCREVGFTSYISKPVNFATLSDVIRDLLIGKASENDNDHEGCDKSSVENNAS
ncbi:5363_t:CDS:10 [Acaulospora morrowiae]|uniref:5363_t:CDS:1 n=1 Tax=Acaulospora morrowiae TaxID=94023 RepID=A0A9N9AHI3_9GLOM|nr:5363_t:CDS:10 [Acaulospora morrowiae]